MAPQPSPPPPPNQKKIVQNVKETANMRASRLFEVILNFNFVINV